MQYQPLNDYVLVKTIKEEEKTLAGGKIGLLSSIHLK